jgi:AraC-like DNA-binding protein/ABC-type branched-subunit amino acid transport system ATPase component
LVLDGIIASRNGHILLELIHLELAAGQSIGIVADRPENLGLLLDVISGFERADRGRVLWDGRVSPDRRRVRQVGVVRETPTLVGTLPVLDNLFLSNPGLYSRLGFLQLSQRRRHARGVLRQLATDADLASPLHRTDPLSRVLLDVARVLIQDPPCLVFQGVTKSMSLIQYEAFATVLQDLKRRKRGILLVPGNAEDIRRLIDRLYILQGTGLYAVDDARDWTDEQLNGLFVGGGKKRARTALDPIFRAMESLRERYAEPEIDFEALAGEIGMSYDNFRRKFKQHTGVPPLQFFLAVKVDKAKELLSFTDFEVKDIAVSLGFPDPYYFSRFFRERTEVSPMQYRHGSEHEGFPNSRKKTPKFSKMDFEKR